MEAFALLKFWKSNTAKVAAGTTASDADAAETTAQSSNCAPLTMASDDDDSFFELELTYDSKFPKPDPSSSKHSLERENEPKSSAKPQSPISILRSASPKLRVFMFGKFKRRTKKQNVESESGNVSSFSNSSKLITVKFKIEDGSIVPSDSISLSGGGGGHKYHRRSFDDCCESSKRFSKVVVQKYLHLIKPNFMASPTKPTAPSKQREEKQSSRFKVKCRQLGKSKSASSVIGASSPAPVSFPAKSDHCYDGIEGAILHCKRSLSSSKGNPSLSRCSSDPSHEKSLIMSGEI